MYEFLWCCPTDFHGKINSGLHYTNYNVKLYAGGIYNTCIYSNNKLIQ